MSDEFFTARSEEQSPAQPAGGDLTAQPQAEENPFPTNEQLGGGFTGDVDLPSDEPNTPAGPGDVLPPPPGATAPLAGPQLLPPPGFQAPQAGGAAYPSAFVAAPQPMAQPQTPAAAPMAQPAPEAVPLEALTLAIDADALEGADPKTLKSIVDHVNKVLERVNSLDTRHGDFTSSYQKEQLERAKDEEYREMLDFDKQVQGLPEGFQGFLGKGSMAALMPGCPQAQYRNHLWGHYNNLLNTYPAVPEEQVFQYALQFAFPGQNGNQEAQELKTALSQRARSGQPRPTRARRSTAPKQYGDQAALDFVQEKFGKDLIPT